MNKIVQGSMHSHPTENPLQSFIPSTDAHYKFLFFKQIPCANTLNTWASKNKQQQTADNNRPYVGVCVLASPMKKKKLFRKFWWKNLMFISLDMRWVGKCVIEKGSTNIHSIYPSDENYGIRKHTQYVCNSSKKNNSRTCDDFCIWRISQNVRTLTQ